MADIPELSYGTVVGRFVAGVADSVDVGVAPDALPMSGTVTFTATAPVLRVVNATPDPATVFPQSIVATLDSEGYLTWNGERGVNLWATDDPDTNPVGWQWKVSFALMLGTTAIPYLGWNFDLPAGTTVDLTEVSPLVTPSPGTIITKGETGDQGPQGLPGEIKNYMADPVPIYAAVGGYQNPLPPGQHGTGVIAPGAAVAFPFIPGADFSIDRIGLSVTTGAAGVTGRLALYASNADGTLPGDLIQEFGVISAAAFGIQELVVSQAFLKGVQYWLALESLGGSLDVRGMSLPGHVRRFATTQAEAYNPGTKYGASWTRAAGAFPASWGGNTYGMTFFPGFAFRRSA